MIISRSAVVVKKAVRDGAVFVLKDKRPTRLAHPDYIELDCTKDPAVDKVKAWADNSDKKPFEAERMCMALLGVDNLNAESSNAVLKLVEEPPDKVTILLSATNTSAIIPTIMSRVFKVYVESDEKSSTDNLQLAYKLLEAAKRGDAQYLVSQAETDSIRDVIEHCLEIAQTVKEVDELSRHIEMIDRYVGKTEVLLSLSRSLA